MSDMYNNAIEDIIDLVRSKKDLVSRELDILLTGERGDLVTKQLDGMANNVCQFFEFYYDYEYTDKSEDECYRLALEDVVDFIKADLVIKDVYINRDLSDREYDDYQHIHKELKDVVRRVQNYFSGRVVARGSSSRGYSGRDYRDSRNDRNSRVPSRNQSSGARSRMFRHDDPGGVKSTTGSSSRSQALAERGQERARQQEIAREEARPQPTNTRASRTGRATSTTTNTSNHQDTRTYITSEQELMFYPRRIGEFTIPHHDPINQRVRAYLDTDGYVTFEILEVINMDAEMHKTVITSLLSKSRENEYVSGVEKRAVYKINQMEISAAQVESEEVNEVMKEWKAAKKIEEKMTFDELNDEMKVNVLNEAANRINDKRVLEAAEKKGKLIEAGEYKEYKSNITIVGAKLNREITSMENAISELIAQYGTAINSDTDRTQGYSISFNKVSVLHRCDSPMQRQLLSNLLAGFKLGNASVETMAQSLEDKKIPLALFTRLNNACTRAINLAIQHILDIPQLHVDDFYEDINPLCNWFTKQIDEGNLTNQQVNQVLTYTANVVGTIAFPKDNTLQTYFPNYKESEIASMKLQCLFSVEKGTIVYVPLLAGELGLSDGINRVDSKNYPFFDTIYPASGHLGAYHYLYTMDGQYYRYIGRNYKTGCIVMEKVHL